MADPLSLLTGVIGILSAAAQASNSFQSLLALRTAPAELVNLKKELDDFHLIVRNLNELTYRDGGSLADSGSGLDTLLGRAKHKWLEVQELVHYILTKPDNQVRKLVWQRERSNVERHLGELRAIMISLSTYLVITCCSSSARLRERLENLSIDPNMLLALHKEFQNLSAQNKRIQESEERTYKAIEHLVELNQQTKQELRRIVCALSGLDQSRAVSNSRLGPRTRLQSAPASDAVGRLRFAHKNLCRKKCCDCSCHKQHDLRSPRLLDGLFGSVSLNYSQNPSKCRRCKTKNCLTRSTSDIRLTLVFPFWVQVCNAFIITANFHQNPELCLRVSLVRPKSDSIFRFAIDGENDMIKTLFATKDASVFDVDEGGDSALHLAIWWHRPETIKLLMSAGADPMAENSWHISAVDVATSQVLGSHLDSETEEICTIFSAYDLVKRQRFPELHKLILGLKDNSDDEDLEGELLFLQCDAKDAINATDRTGRTALSWAAQRCDLRAISRLLECGADPNKLDQEGRSPLHWCSWAGHRSCVLSLLETQAHAQSGQKDYVDSKTAMQTLMCGWLPEEDGIAQVLEAFINAGSELNFQDEDGWNVLHFAVVFDRATTTEFLISRARMNIDTRSSRGSTPVTLAVKWNGHNALRLLLKHGADYTLKDNSQSSILHWAARAGDSATLCILQHAHLQRLDTAYRDSKGLTARQAAERRREFMDQGADEWFVAFEALLESVERTES